MWKLELRPRYSFSGIICFEISVFCLCSVLYVLLSLYGGGVSVTQHNSDSFEFLCVDTHLVSKQNSLSSLVQYSWMETGMGEAVEGIIKKKAIVNIVFAQQSLTASSLLLLPFRFSSLSVAQHPD
jgi:hypothetical protein